jgi:hypothetical protein
MEQFTQKLPKNVLSLNKMSFSITSGGQEYGTASLIPWDCEAFGFPVGRIALASNAPGDSDIFGLRASIQEWTATSNVRLVSVSVPAAASAWMQALHQLDFVCIDTSLSVKMTALSARRKAIRSVDLRPADMLDRCGLESLAESVFEFGRYHRDTRFPRYLANRRFRNWVSNALHRPNFGEHFLVAGPIGDPSAFLFYSVEDNVADWHLAGISRGRSDVTPGPMLFSGALDHMESLSVRCVSSVISPSNVPVLNIYSALGFRFFEPSFIYHLIPLGTSFPSEHNDHKDF